MKMQVRGKVFEIALMFAGPDAAIPWSASARYSWDCKGNPVATGSGMTPQHAIKSVAIELWEKA